ncbi:MAG: family 20 glycosylhydrolase [Sphingobacteriaceae bacterium]
MRTSINQFGAGFILLLLLVYQPGFSQSARSPFKVDDLQVSWQVIENNHDQKPQSLTSLSFTNKGAKKIPANGWYLYFNFSRTINSLSVKGGNIEQVNGDLFRLKLNNAIEPMDTASVNFISADWVVNFTDAPSGLYVVFNEEPTKGITLKNFIIKPSKRPEQYLRSPTDKIGLISPDIIFRQNENIKDIPADQLPKIFPTPTKYTETSGSFILDKAVAINADSEFIQESALLTQEIALLLGKTFKAKAAGEKTIFLRKKPMGPEAYELQVTSKEITLSAGDRAGMFYAIQSLKSLMPPKGWEKVNMTLNIPAVEVADAPRFGFRGVLLDVARNFQTKAEILRLLDIMALYKLNVFHFHLNDDEGWRLEIPSLPELTSIGSKRGHTLDSKDHLPPSVGSGPNTENPNGSGFYSKAEFIEILKYANDRHIRVIPEMETPGHARAAIKAMDARFARLKKEGNKDAAIQYLLRDTADQSVYHSVQYWNDNVMDVALPSTYRFIETLIDEISEMYNAAGATLQTIHFGGDEVPEGVWQKSPACNALMQQDSTIKTVDDLWYYYFGKVNSLLKKKGLYLSGWEEIALRKTILDGKKENIPNPDFVNQNFHVNVWNNVLGWGAEDLAYKLANAGYKVILSCVSNLYFDMAYYKAFDEPGYYWGAFVDVDKPFYFIPYDYFKNAKEDPMGAPLNRSIFIGKQRLSDYGKQNIVGIQGLLWSETVKGPQRMEYMMLPKLLGLAERAWAKDPEWATEKDSIKSMQLYEQDWSVFTNVLGKRELPRLDHYSGGYNYRIPSPGAIINQGKVVVNSQLPGLTIRYTTDGKDPNLKSRLYERPITEKGVIKLSSFSTTGRVGKMIVIENQ